MKMRYKLAWALMPAFFSLSVQADSGSIHSISPLEKKMLVTPNHLPNLVKLHYLYSRTCARAGVPVPPAFNSDGSTGWKREGALGFSILNPNAYSELYTYTPANRNGLCMALAIRANQTQGTYDALGIICQGLSTTNNLSVSNSRACFWDNATTAMVPGKTYPIDGPTFLAPPKLPSNNQCSDCHAGENAFITHEGSVIDIAKKNFNNTNNALNKPNFTSRNNWYKPIVDSAWPQNPEPPNSYNNGNGLSGATCVSCHKPSYAGRIPDVTGAVGGNPGRDKLFLYCWAIASGEISSGSGPHAASVNQHVPGPMNSYAGGGQLGQLYQACSTVIPIFMNFPATEQKWIDW